MTPEEVRAILQYWNIIKPLVIAIFILMFVANLVLLLVNKRGRRLNEETW